MATLSTLVPTNYVLTSGVNSAMSWTNVLTLSTVNTSTIAGSSISMNTVNASALTVSTLAVSSLATTSTMTSRLLNYSSLIGSSINTTTATLSLANVNASTQQTQLYSLAGTTVANSFSAIQAAFVSTGTTNNILALNPLGGNVGVGTTVPGAPLQVNANTTTVGTLGQTLMIGNPMGNGASRPALGVGAANTSIWGCNSGSSGDDSGLLRIAAGGGNGATLKSYIDLSGFSTIPDMDRNIVFGTSSVERMRILASGNVGIGNTNPQSRLHIADTTPEIKLSCPYKDSVGAPIGNLTFDSEGVIAASIRCINEVGGANNNGALLFSTTLNSVNQNIIRMNISRSGTVFINAYTTNGTVTTINSNGQLSVSSDRRIKENIVYQTDTQQGLASIVRLKPAIYQLISGSGTHLGFIAQDLEEEIPLAVDGKKYEWEWEFAEDGKSPKFDEHGDIVYKLDEHGEKIVRPRGVSDRAIIATQTLAIQELAKQNERKDAQISSLESQTALLESQTALLESQMASLESQLMSLLAWATVQGYSA